MRADYEYRRVETEFECRSEGNKLIIAGYAAIFNSRSQNLGGFVEDIQQGTFAKTIKEADVRALFNHDPSLILGRNRAGTLRMVEDTKGLHYEVDLPDTSTGRDLFVSMERGDVTQSSFGFATITDSWGFTEDDFPLRTLKEVALRDVSPVTYPAYLETTSEVGAREPGLRALQRLAEMRNLELDAVRNDLAGILKSENETPVNSATYVVRRYDPRDILVLRGR